MNSNSINKTILLLTPYYKSQRGNSLTVSRLRHGLGQRGYILEVLSLEEAGWEATLRAALKEKRYALIHGFHGFYFGQALQSVPEMKELPLVLTTTGTDINYHVYEEDKESILAGILTVATKIVVFHQNFTRKMTTRYPFLAEKLVTIPQGVYLPETGCRRRERSQLGIADNDIVFLLPSGLREVKNIDLAINALEKVQQECAGVRLLIMGAAIEPNYARRIQRRLKQSDWAINLGEVAHEEIKSIMQLGDIVLNTSHAEGQPQGLLEAMSLSKPGILSAVPGNLELINHGVEGFYIKKEEDLVSTARALVLDSDLRKKMGSAAARLVATRFTVARELDAYAGLYQEILGG